MRVSTQQLYHGAQQKIEIAREKEVRSSEKASTQLQINRPSDDPTHYLLAENSKADLSGKEVISKNANYAKYLLSSTESILSTVQDSLQRAHEVAIPASTELIYPKATRQNLSLEVRSLKDNIIRALNTKFNGKSLLSGFQTRTNPFDGEGEYQGDAGEIKIEVAKNQSMPLSLDTRKIIMGEGMKTGVNIMNVFDKLIDGLENNHRDQVRTTLDDFLIAIDQISLGKTQIGANMSALERATVGYGEERINLKDHISSMEELDIIEGFSNLVRDQNVLKTAILSNQKILAEDPAQLLFK